MSDCLERFCRSAGQPFVEMQLYRPVPAAREECPGESFLIPPFQQRAGQPQGLISMQENAHLTLIVRPIDVLRRGVWPGIFDDRASQIFSAPIRIPPMSAAHGANEGFVE